MIAEHDDVGSCEVQQWATLSGTGIGALTRYQADAEPGLIRIVAGTLQMVRDIWLRVHVDVRLMLRVRTVMDAVIEALRSNAATLNPDG